MERCKRKLVLVCELYFAMVGLVHVYRLLDRTDTYSNNRVKVNGFVAMVRNLILVSKFPEKSMNKGLSDLDLSSQDINQHLPL